MLPVLFTIGPVKIYTFGVFLLLAFLWGCFFLWKNIKLTAEKEEIVFDGLFISLASGLFFSRLIFVLLNFSQFGLNPLKFILINGYPGLSLFGFFIGGFFALFLFFSSKNIEGLSLIDYFISPIFLSLFIGKIGSFLAGVDLGNKTNFIFSVEYLGVEGKRHLVGLYEAFFFGLAVYFSYKILLLVRRQMLPKGFVFYFFLFYFGMVNLLLDKAKENHLYFFGVSFNFYLSIIFVFVFGVYFLHFFIKRPETKKAVQNFFSRLKVSLFIYGQKNQERISGKDSKRTLKEKEEFGKKS